MSELSARDREILDFEGRWWEVAETKEAGARERFGLGPGRYQEVVSSLIDRPEALAHAPLTVKRLRRLRAARIAGRSAARRSTGS
jgi:hypothetical protein